MVSAATAVREASAVISPSTAFVQENLTYDYTVTNSVSSTANIGSITIALPDGFETPTTITVSAGWVLANGTFDGSVYTAGYSTSARRIGIKASASANKLAPGSSVTIGVTTTALTSGSHEWTTAVPGTADIFANLGFDGNTYTLTSPQPTVMVSKVTPTVVLTNSPLVYTGTSLEATATSSVPGVISNITYSGTTTVPTNAGTYAVTADFTPTDTTTYESLVGASAGDLEIRKADASISVATYTVTYDGTAHTASSTLTGVNGEDLSAQLDLSGTIHTNAGDYPADIWTFTGGSNYNDQHGTLHNVINKAMAAVTVTPYSVVFDGTAHTSVGTAIGVLGESLTGLDVASTTHTAIGAYSGDAWTYTDVTGNYADASGTVDNVITEPSVVATPQRGNRGARTAVVVPTVPATPAVAGVSTVAPGNPASPAVQAQVLGVTTYNFDSNLRYRMHDASVAELQKMLVARGYSIPDAVTTYFGPQTLAATKAFQKANNLPVTGFVGPLTRTLLNKGT